LGREDVLRQVDLELGLPAGPNARLTGEVIDDADAFDETVEVEPFRSFDQSERRTIGDPARLARFGAL
jgi:hypothetical protein